MTVYVDKPLHRVGRMVMCHMMADTPDELHRMADLIGVERKHFQADASTPHYDICKQKRAIAVGAGAKEVDRRSTVAVIRKLRAARPPRFKCSCGWKGNKPIRAECATCPDCGAGL